MDYYIVKYEIKEVAHTIIPGLCSGIGVGMTISLCFEVLISRIVDTNIRHRDEIVIKSYHNT